MTLCIAAVCGENGTRNRIAFCCDTRIGDESSGSEIELKLRVLETNWWVMYAGKAARAKELMDIYKAYLKIYEYSSLTVTNDLRIPLTTIQERIADNYIRNNYAISYQEFLKSSKSFLSDDAIAQTLSEIGFLVGDIDVQLILIYCAENEVRLFEVAADVSECTHYSIAGSGSQIAAAILDQREQQQTCDVDQTLYTLFEAKKLAEIGPHVGEDTLIGVLQYEKTRSSQVEFKIISSEGKKQLSKHFSKIGPKKYKSPTTPFSNFYTNATPQSETHPKTPHPTPTHT
ncbi:MAG: hypothetical protein ACKVS6_06855 [Planctomycetota bacterium]